MKGPRTLAIAAFAFAIAVTPLGSFLNGGVFETFMPAEYGRSPVRVLVHDHTGLVAATATYSSESVASVTRTDARTLLVPWQVCGGQADLTFARAKSGYVVISPSRAAGWCGFFSPSNNGVTALSLRAPIDRATVQFPPIAKESAD
jgi:hypothetical protein